MKKIISFVILSVCLMAAAVAILPAQASAQAEDALTVKAREFLTALEKGDFKLAARDFDETMLKVSGHEKDRALHLRRPQRVNIRRLLTFAAHLKQIWLEPDKKSARRGAAALIDDYGKRFPEAVRCLEEGLEDSLSFYDFPEVDKKRISSANGQERLNLEILRRSRVVGVFPSVESYVRLAICYLVEYS